MSHSQVNIFIIFIWRILMPIDVAIMKMWDIAMSNESGRGLASFVWTINSPVYVTKGKVSFTKRQSLINHLKNSFFITPLLKVTDNLTIRHFIPNLNYMYSLVNSVWLMSSFDVLARSVAFWNLVTYKWGHYNKSNLR